MDIVVPAVVPQLSATVVLLRDADGSTLVASSSGLQVLLVQRNPALRFYGGAWVFPGGRVDAGDRMPTSVRDAELAAARHAAAREVREESALEVGVDRLVPFACWTTPEGREIRFRTWFFAANMSGTPSNVHVDGQEIHAHRWLTPIEALAAYAAGELELSPPTLVTLIGFADHVAASAALQALEGRAPRMYTPRIAGVPEGICYLYEGDAGYATADATAVGPRHRLWLQGRSYRYESRDAQSTSSERAPV